ncbi:hypothetical protein EV178_005531 [Coemansia sp. RSA 1646]|nr:hypothetical protein EV178_005531 [Coemansia sp. RSA 1646]
MFAFTTYKIIFVSVAALMVLLTVLASYHILDVSSAIQIGQPQQPQQTHQPQQQQSPQPTEPQAEQPSGSTEQKLTEEQRQQFIQEQKQKPLLPKVNELYSLKPVREASENITSTVFMLRGDFSSSLYDLFSLHKRATRYCDKDTKISGCNVKLSRNYRWGTLSDKLLDVLEHMCKTPKRTDFYVKIDDDLVMSESKLDEVIKVMATTDCQITGGIARDYGFYWPVGQIYIFKRAILEKICPQLPVTNVFHPSEDITFGSLLNTTDRSMFCNLDIREASENITSTVFMFRGDFSSDFYDLFSLQKRAVRYCDNDTTISGCDVKLPRNYKWGTLSSKLLDALEVMCKAPKKTDFYVKIDDDLIMSESKLDEVIKRMSTTDCQVSGRIARDFEFYWAVGQIYIFKRAILETICAKLPITRQLHGSEDISFGSFINSTDRSMFCDLDTPRNHWHKDYSDKRIKIEYLIQHNE